MIHDVNIRSVSYSILNQRSVDLLESSGKSQILNRNVNL